MVEHRVWSVECEVWSVECEVWSVDNGGWRVENMLRKDYKPQLEHMALSKISPLLTCAKQASFYTCTLYTNSTCTIRPTCSLVLPQAWGVQTAPYISFSHYCPGHNCWHTLNHASWFITGLTVLHMYMYM